jgi:Protein of unknown function (DUF664)
MLDEVGREGEMQITERIQSWGQSRRGFLQATSAALLLAPAAQSAETGPNVLGPTAGYSPHIGTLVSEMTWMRSAVLGTVRGMTRDQLDFLLDNNANRCGALLQHLAATEKLYQLATFDNVSLATLEQSAAFKDWKVPMDLGAPARAAIKGHDLNYYLDQLHDGREKTLAEFRKRDDQWLLAVDQKWPWGPTNNLCKWFHVCEHESHHSGQIALLKGRAPGAKPDNG